MDQAGKNSSLFCWFLLSPFKIACIAGLIVFAHVRVLAASKPRTAQENSKHLLSILQTALQLLCENFTCANVPVGYKGFFQQVVCGFQNTYV